MSLPFVSVIIPTLNAEKVVRECLESIASQDYPADRLEIVVADGGSEDRTREIAQKFGARVVDNLLKTGEAGKAIALRAARGDLIALIDSDNILPTREWFSRMVLPFVEDREVLVSEPIEFTWRQKDGFITRYCALIGANDPLVVFLGNYDRYNFLTGSWTGLDVGPVTDRGSYLVFDLNSRVVPTIGANGTIMARSFLERVSVGSHLFDIDLITKAVGMGLTVRVAKVKVGIIHLYCGSDIHQFVRKQDRRIRDFIYNQKIGSRVYEWHKQNKVGILLFCLASILFLPTFYQAFYGYSRKKDRAWFFHPLACFLTLGVYILGVLRSQITAKEADRSHWSQ